MSKNNAKPENDQAFLGLKKVSLDTKKKAVHQIFDSVASKYDLMNDCMSFGLHRKWKDSLVEAMPLRENNCILDMASGTGDIAFKIHQKAKKLKIPVTITNGDLTFAMLSQSLTRAIDKGILGLCPTTLDAQSLPFQDESFDHYVISFGLRNVPSRAKALQEAFRALKPNGHFFCMEFSHIFLPPLQKIYKLYASHLIPKMGEKLGKDKEAYQYLIESIESFPNQNDLAAEMREAGFEKVNYRNLSFGLVAIHFGQKLE